MRARRATEADLPAMLALGCAMRAESKIPFPDIDAKELRAMIDLYGGSYFMAVAEKAEEIVGMISAQPGRFMFAKEMYAIHDIFYVRPESRGSRAALMLVQAFEDWAEEIGARRVVIAVHTGLHTERTGGFYKKLGFRHMGGNYMKEL